MKLLYSRTVFFLKVKVQGAERHWSDSLVSTRSGALHGAQPGYSRYHFYGIEELHDSRLISGKSKLGERGAQMFNGKRHQRHHQHHRIPGSCGFGVVNFFQNVGLGDNFIAQGDGFSCLFQCESCHCVVRLFQYLRAAGRNDTASTTGTRARLFVRKNRRTAG